jgi:hypothetical protein
MLADDSTPTGGSDSAMPVDPTGACALLAAIHLWEKETAPRIQKGVVEADAQPSELVDAFRPWLAELLEIAPIFPLMDQGWSRNLKHALDAVLDRLEQTYSVCGQRPAIPLAELAPLEDLLIALELQIGVPPTGSNADTRGGNVE